MLPVYQILKSLSSFRRNPSVRWKSIAEVSIPTNLQDSENSSSDFPHFAPSHPQSSSSCFLSVWSEKLRSKLSSETWSCPEQLSSGRFSPNPSTRRQLSRQLQQLRPLPTDRCRIRQRRAPTWACDTRPSCGSRCIGSCRRRCRHHHRRRLIFLLFKETLRRRHWKETQPMLKDSNNLRSSEHY